jgi:hypothetical protein
MRSLLVLCLALSGTASVAAERLAANGAVLQTASAGTGSSASPRFENDTGADVVGERIHVRSGGCAATCGPEAGFRIRAFDTSSSIARFNNQASQVTVLVLNNASGSADPTGLPAAAGHVSGPPGQAYASAALPPKLHRASR